MKKRPKILAGILLAFAVLSAAGFALRDQIWYLMNVSKPGNAEEYRPENAAQNPDSPLRGKTIIFLGSSVTKGESALSTSFVEYMEQIDGIIAVKEAVSGTTLVTEGDKDGKSYIPRLKTIGSDIKADCFVCQLSTNDATQGKALGAVSNSFEAEDFATETVAGAIEYIIAYVRDTWNCPVVFYTGTKYDSEAYGEMVKLLLEIQQKWDIGVINLWNSDEMNRVNEVDYALYMADGIHPTQAGYLLWWTPQFERYLIEYMELQ